MGNLREYAPLWVYLRPELSKTGNKYLELFCARQIAMVRILSNGDIVPDDDPRAQQAASNRGSNSARPRQGFVQHDDSHQGPGAGRGFIGQGDGQVSVFTLINQKLLELGIPRFSVGPYTVEPIALVGMILALLLFGLPGLLFGGVLFLVVMSSQTAAPAGNQRRAAGGGGHRLG